MPPLVGTGSIGRDEGNVDANGEAQAALADCLVELGDSAGARKLAAQVQANLSQPAELGEHFKAPLRAVQARLHQRESSYSVN